jgi:acyl transferase domain-containing protein/NADPH:quinone reductase-like Zn-dependent oxidoreductase/NADP-dependent 3-hydroxy acid dehydrogenase YdfG/acyl carrier protein
MKTVHQLRDDIAVVGWSCRLPGANSIDQLWSLLLEGRCAVTRLPEDRFPLQNYSHPRKHKRGKSYTWAAGVLDDIWSFDPGVFRISPREAAQIDPQQRLLLQLTWEALEDAGIRPSSIAGSDVGVYVGASQTDYGHSFFRDPSVTDAHSATGTALAILANRISHVYGLHGPSLTIDTACSSSLVALHQAMEALRSGRIDTAIVGGCNLLAGPSSWVGFSQAGMLSEKGLCQAFAADADGFVRAEGAVVLILRKAAHAHAQKNPVHGLVLASDVNSDGRTNGISMPNLEAQETLLQRLYARHKIDFDRLAFIEAHGTGTAVGDPIEAAALGRSIGRNRAASLTIGSIKTNIGHLEPASGLAGVLKAILALNHGILPASLHFNEPNPAIDFAALNVRVCTQPLLLPKSAGQYAGVNSFGFGGTNAHAVVAAGPKAPLPQAGEGQADAEIFALSANSSASLIELAQHYAERVPQLSDQETATLASAIMHRRERQPNRIVISSVRSEEVARALNAVIAGTQDAALTTGTAIGDEMPVACVYSGNGSQWVGMGRSAYRKNQHFRARFDQVDGYFKQIGGWSLKDAMFSDTLDERLALTSIAQPLIFGIQVASTAALRASGLRPAAVLGHSVGEVAAAEAAGILDLRTATKVIYYRSMHQELTRDLGRMAAVFASAESLQPILASIEGLEIAAINSPRTVTIAGPAEALAHFKQLAAGREFAFLDLDLDYPFHTKLMAPVEPKLRADLRDLIARDADVPFVSSVTGTCLPGSRLDGNYWWRNVREQVQFSAAVRATAELGARYFIEVGPRPALLKHIADSLRNEVNGFATASILDRSDDDIDPFDKARAKALVNGARIETDKAFGPDPGPGIQLPLYPWERKAYRLQSSVEMIDADADRHPLAGSRHTPEALVWRSNVDIALHPMLADHTVRGQAIFPGTAFLEIALAVARQWLRADSVIVSEFEILAPLDLTNGETREVMTRLSPGSNTIEILSRPRLSRGGWILNCRGKIQTGNATYEPLVPPVSAVGEVVDGAKLYEIADDSGLRYGPAFRLAERVVVHDEKLISIDLAPSDGTSEFLLDPVRTDCCGHGLFALLPRLGAKERGVTYIPVRVEETALHRPHVPPQRAVIEVISKSDHALVSNCHLLGPQNEVVAVMRGVRGQAISTRRATSLDATAFVELPRLVDGMISGRIGFPGTAGDLMATAGAMGLTQASATASNDAETLLEGWATAAAYEIARGLADKGVLDVEGLRASGRLDENVRPWLVNLLVNLEAAGLARRDRNAWILIDDGSLPPSAAVVKALATEHQCHAGELLLAAAISGFAKQIAAGKAVPSETDQIVGKAALDFYDSANLATREASAALYRILIENKRFWPNDRALRVLQIGCAPLAQSLLSSEHANKLILTLFEPNRRRFESADLALSKTECRLVGSDQTHELGKFDLIVSLGGLHRLPRDLGLADVREFLSPGGLLAAIEPGSSLFKDLVFGLDSDWFRTGAFDRPISRLRPVMYWPNALNEAGFRNSVAALVNCGTNSACLVVAEAPPVESGSVTMSGQQADHAASKSALLVASIQQSAFATKLKAALIASGAKASIAADSSELSEAAGDIVVLAPEDVADPADPVEALTRRCLDIKACAEKLDGLVATLWLVFRGALMGSAPVRPVEAGAWAFSRTLANELPKLDIRRIDIASDLSADSVAAEIERILASGTNERELQIDKQSTRAVRVMHLRHAAQPGHERVAAVLRRRSQSGQRLSWKPMERKRPADDEVEVEVEAAGLNFRDLMLSLGFLPEDMLENGMSGPTLGLEFAGKIVRIGRRAGKLQVGDRVLGFAGSSFATHLTVKAEQALRLPSNLSSEAAATIPVAFFTAYYSLITQARLSRREWVLIHGGAGGVGLAAIQIAQSRGARIIASAGSPAKRDLLRAMGVRHVVDSRSTTFVDDVRQITGQGVDVVLNSLAGEAMERSIGCLRPFGRFVELGKRDYVGNTHVGLRPFRQNLSYFGVDVDQVMNGRAALGTRTFVAIMKQFEKGAYVPLPYSVFDASDVSEAFHVMQKSVHIGKIVIRPNVNGGALPRPKPFQVNPERTHVITGAFGGFGMETAKWLVEQGARHIVMVGRRGASTPEAQAVLQDFRAHGVKVVADPCDVTDRAALERLFETLHTTMPPIAGVMHAAMVLDDALLVNLDKERFHRVLAPKIAGAENLDRLVRGMPLDYFIMFSSISTLIGNPGQANYVAANAYMEGLARSRRQKGLAALAVGWGPISDVGVIARNKRLRGVAEKIAESSGLLAREALDLMAQAIQHSPAGIESAVITIAPQDGSFGSGRLAVLRSPTYANFVSRNQKLGDTEADNIDLHALAAAHGAEVARKKVVDVVTAQLAHVLHLRREDIGPMRPLGEIGLDSLMAVELAMSLENSFHIQIPLRGSAGAMTVSDIADEVVAQIGLDPDREDAAVHSLVQQHVTRPETLDQEAFAEFKNEVASEAKAAKRLLS